MLSSLLSRCQADQYSEESPPRYSWTPAALITQSGSESAIILIHGACVDRRDWDLMTPHPSEYHLLVPDQICHGEAAHIQPYTYDYAAAIIAQLIKKKARNGKTHVVGLSLGAGVSLRLAAKYPDVVESVTISGVSKLPTIWATPYLPYRVWLSQHVSQPDLSRCTLDLNKEIFGTTLVSEAEWRPAPRPARTLIVAATKAGIVPPNDNVELARTAAEIGRRLKDETRAVQHRRMRHPWNRQDPRLFAELVRAWVEGQPLPGGFERL